MALTKYIVAVSTKGSQERIKTLEDQRNTAEAALGVAQQSSQIDTDQQEYYAKCQVIVQVQCSSVCFALSPQCRILPLSVHNS